MAPHWMTDPVEAMLVRLIKIPSVNPEGDPGTHLTGEQALASELAKWLTDWGFNTRLEPIRDGRPNLIALAPGSSKRKRVLFAPHLDTVGVGGMTIPPFEAKTNQGKLYGRGASDTKGSMAAMLWALREHAPRLASLPIAVDFVAFMGEESNQWGSRHFAQKHANNYEFALVGEPTSLDLVYTTKGSCWATLACQGKAAHSSRPDMGENALEIFMSRWPNFKNHLLANLNTTEHPILGKGTLSLGVMHGGTRPNIVPDQVTAQIDVRLIPGQRGSHLVEAAAAASQLQVLSLKEAPATQVPTDNPWMQHLAKIAPHSKPVGAPWFSDAGHLNAVGIPAICVGPGSIDQAHTNNEFISLDSLREGAQWFSHFLTTLSSLSST